MNTKSNLAYIKQISQCSILLLSLIILCTGSASARGTEFHKAPFDFMFGNHIDTHQENKLTLNRDGDPTALSGFFYIIYMDGTEGTAIPVAGPNEAFIDPVSGLPVARHPRGAGDHNEICGETVTCYVGWTMKGLPANAKFLYHSGVNGDDHPVWLVNRSDVSSDISAIPQPGEYMHFHWIASASNDPRAFPVLPNPACDQQTAGGFETTGGANEICAGWFLEIKAIRQFAFIHGGEIIPIRPGTDNRSHLNLVTNYDHLTGGTITSTRP